MQGMTMEEMGSGLPTWLTTVSWLWIVAAVLSAAVVLFDLYGGGRRPQRPLMAAIWPLSALYLGPLAIVLQRRDARRRAAATSTSSDAEAGLALGLHGGVASGLAHIVGVPIVVLTGLTIAGFDMWAMVAIITVLATIMLVLFELAVVASPTDRQASATRLRTAAVIALVTVVAFDVGMLGWMLVLHYSENMPMATDVRFTFLMQVGLVLGTLTAAPIARRLSRRTTHLPAQTV
ncbi:DUF4396 domain-containing protein [Patulibacter brassicae]|uniref:DUF4396 domain-containing protein n=1 Tax=Patulibacter brassicae TaxID=1705717 RepID=A0ABU4VEI5_9ACTN|nr:DUF4396 domain-containing protein [Patulibacter brassicae]MDX8150205.1 DUF4396 domain-containing protein [Patulibacter brassicae]